MRAGLPLLVRPWGPPDPPTLASDDATDRYARPMTAHGSALLVIHIQRDALANADGADGALAPLVGSVEGVAAANAPAGRVRRDGGRRPLGSEQWQLDDPPVAGPR